MGTWFGMPVTKHHATCLSLYIITLLEKHTQANMHILPAAHMVLHIHHTAKNSISLTVAWHNMLSDHQ